MLPPGVTSLYSVFAASNRKSFINFHSLPIQSVEEEKSHIFMKAAKKRPIKSTAFFLLHLEKKKLQKQSVRQSRDKQRENRDLDRRRHRRHVLCSSFFQLLSSRFYAVAETIHLPEGVENARGKKMKNHRLDLILN